MVLNRLKEVSVILPTRQDDGNCKKAPTFWILIPDMLGKGRGPDNGWEGLG